MRMRHRAARKMSGVRANAEIKKYGRSTLASVKHAAYAMK